MPNDAKFGLVLGVALVIAVGVMLSQREPAGAPPQAAQTTPTAGYTEPTVPVLAGSQSRPASATPAGRSAMQSPAAPPQPTPPSDR
jgi:hypothetical protein